MESGVLRLWRRRTRVSMTTRPLARERFSGSGARFAVERFTSGSVTMPSTACALNVPGFTVPSELRRCRKVAVTPHDTENRFLVRILSR